MREGVNLPAIVLQWPDEHADRPAATLQRAPFSRVCPAPDRDFKFAGDRISASFFSDNATTKVGRTLIAS